MWSLRYLKRDGWAICNTVSGWWRRLAFEDQHTSFSVLTNNRDFKVQLSEGEREWTGRHDEKVQRKDERTSQWKLTIEERRRNLFNKTWKKVLSVLPVKTSETFLSLSPEFPCFCYMSLTSSGTTSEATLLKPITTLELYSVALFLADEDDLSLQTKTKAPEVWPAMGIFQVTGPSSCWL